MRSPYGAITTFDVPGASYTSPTAINPAGEITGFYFLNGSGAYHGFVRARTGALTTFDVPSGVFTQPVAIDPAGAITGNYEDANGVLHGFLREGAGAITTFDAPGLNIRTQPVGITPAGAIAGWNLLADLSAAHGFLRARNGTFTIFDPPESKGTITTAINLEGAITGTYFDANNVGHGFLRIPCERCDEAASNSLNQPVPIRPMGSVLLYRMRILANHDLHHSLLPGLPY